MLPVTQFLFLHLDVFFFELLTDCCSQGQRLRYLWDNLKLRHFKQCKHPWSLANVEVKLYLQRRGEKKLFQIFPKWRKVISWTSGCLILVRTRKIFFFLRKNITIIWHINIPISAGKRRPISWSASISFIFHSTVLTKPLFITAKLERQLQRGQSTHRFQMHISNHVTCSPHEDTSQNVEDHFLNFLKESLWLIEQEKCKMWI